VASLPRQSNAEENHSFTAAKVKVQNEGGAQPNTDFTMKRSRPRVEDFTVGWISALPIERTAATVMLDEEYDVSDDTTQYTLGRIGSHNVVVICLPAGRIGTSSAAIVATEMRFKFPALQIGLMVGIGGGFQAPKRTFDLEMW
jgi:hypothetical protein